MTRASDDLALLLDGSSEGSAPPGTAPLLAALTLARSELDERTALRPEFRDALRTRLLAVATVQQPAPAPVRPAARSLLGSLLTPRRAVATAGALAGIVALTGVGVAADRSVPGDLFYGAKRTAESVRLGVSGGDETERGLRHLHLATARLGELETLSTGSPSLGLGALSGRPVAGGASRAQVVATLDDMDDDVRTGSRLILDQYRDDREAGPLVVLQGWSRTQADRLRALLPHLSSAVQPRGEASLALVREVEADATKLLAACAPACDDEQAGQAGDPDVSPSPSAVPTPGTTPRPTTPAPTAPGSSPAVPRRPSATTPEPTDGSGGGRTVPRLPLPTLPPRTGGTSTTGPLPSVILPTAGLPTGDLPSVPLPGGVTVPVPELPTLPVPRVTLPTGGLSGGQ